MNSRLTYRIIGFSLLTFVVLCGAACSRTSAAYRLTSSPAIMDSSPEVAVAYFIDARTDTEKSGTGAGFMNRATKDALFSDTISEAIAIALVDELCTRGVRARIGSDAPIKITGVLNSFRATIRPPRTGMLPYVNRVTWMWTKDRVNSSVAFDLTLSGSKNGEWSRAYAAETTDTEWVGIAGIASSARRWDKQYLVRVLRENLRDVLGKAADEIAAEIGRRDE